MDEFDRWRRHADLAIAVAAIKALAGVVRMSEASTMMELEIELKEASDALKQRHRTFLSLSAGCDLFLRFVTRTLDAEEDLAKAKGRLIERGEKFSEISLKARQSVALLAHDFISDRATVLVHGFSRVLLSIFTLAAANGKHFSVIITEGRVDGGGRRMAAELARLNIPLRVILDAAVGAYMGEVDLVLVGAEAVVESGGIINTLGTFQVAIVAKALKKPVYVAAESFKFARIYPLDQHDWQPTQEPLLGKSPSTLSPVPLPADDLEDSAKSFHEEFKGDYTPPEYLSLLFTDLGVLTPSAVSDELIQLFI